MTSSPLGTALKTVALDDVRMSVTKDEKWMSFLFQTFFVRPQVTAAFDTTSFSEAPALRLLRCAQDDI